MKHCIYSYDKTIVQHKDNTSVKNSEKIYKQSQLSEYDIIELHNKFLTVGFQNIAVSSVEAGRKLIYTFLDSLPWYQHCGVLTTERDCTVALKTATSDIYQTLLNSDYTTTGSMAISSACIEDFFLHALEFDCLWIEATPNLVSQVWVPYFKQQLIDLNIDKQTPILIVTYGEKSKERAYSF